MPRMDGMTLMKETKKFNPDILVVVITAYGTVESAVEAMKKNHDLAFFFRVKKKCAFDRRLEIICLILLNAKQTG